MVLGIFKDGPRFHVVPSGLDYRNIRVPLAPHQIDINCKCYPHPAIAPEGTIIYMHAKDTWHE